MSDVASIAVTTQPTKTEYAIGDALDLSGMAKLEKLDVSGCSKLQSLKLAGCSALMQLDASSCALTVARPHGLQRAETSTMLV